MKVLPKNAIIRPYLVAVDRLDKFLRSVDTKKSSVAESSSFIQQLPSCLFRMSQYHGNDFNTQVQWFPTLVRNVLQKLEQIASLIGMKM